MVRKGAIWTLSLMLAVVLLGNVVLATPTPPYLIVNHTDKLCAESILGDDCSWCEPPPGWEVVGLSSASQCPGGYRRVERIDMECQRYENAFCCSGGSHRGNCENMVVHDGDVACAFVDDVRNCVLPAGWRARPPGVDPARWSCPMGYGWVQGVECKSRDLEPDTPARASTALAVGCLLAVMITVVSVSLALVFVVVRRRRD